MSTHNICFRGEIRKIFTGYPPLSRPMIVMILFWFFFSGLSCLICHILDCFLHTAKINFNYIVNDFLV